MASRALMSCLSEKYLLEVARMLRAGSICVEVLVCEAIENRKRHAELLGTYVAADPESALVAAKQASARMSSGGDEGVLHGVPVSVKDLFGVTGYPTYAGSPDPLPSKWTRSGPIVRIVEQSHAVIIGKTHTVEFAFGGIGMNLHWGTPRNPWDAERHRVPGGSSAGAGLSLLEGSALVAFGTDTAGSVRIPASYSGTVGLKTTIGRWSTKGIVPLSPTLDTVGFLAKSVADARSVYRAIEGSGSRDFIEDDTDLPNPSDLHLIVPRDFFWEGCSPGVAEGVQETIAEIERAGARIEETKFETAHAAYEVFLEGGPVAPEFAEFIATELPQSRKTLDPNVARRIEGAVSTKSPVYAARLDKMQQLGRLAADRLGERGILLTPTVALSPPQVDALSDSEVYRKANLTILRNTGVVNYLGLCALSMPVALDACGMPVGLQLIAGPGMEENLLRVGCRIEKILGRMPERLGQPPLLRAARSD